VSEAVDEKLRRNELAALLDELDAKYGPPARSAKSWAKKVLARSSWTPVLIAFERADPRMPALLREVLRQGTRLIVPATVLGQVWRDGARQTC